MRLEPGGPRAPCGARGVAGGPLEVANALTVLVRRRKLTESEHQAALGWLGGLHVRIDDEAAALAWSTLSELAAAYELSIYEAAYLELAHRRKLLLGCNDGPLRKAAQRANVRLWG
jgi:predicted nucleic acid-binding protein